MIKVFDTFSDKKALERVKPEKIFCGIVEQDRCLVQHNGTPYYYDDDHLSDAGAKMVVSKIISSLNQEHLYKPHFQAPPSMDISGIWMTFK